MPKIDSRSVWIIDDFIKLLEEAFSSVENSCLSQAWDNLANCAEDRVLHPKVEFLRVEDDLIAEKEEKYKEGQIDETRNHEECVNDENINHRHHDKYWSF